MEYKVYSGKSVEEALTSALIDMAITSDQVEYEVIEKGSSGFLGVGSKDAVIRVRKKETIQESEETFSLEGMLSEEAPAEEIADKTPEEVTEETVQAEEVPQADISPEKAAETFLSDVLPLMGAKVSVSIDFDHDENVMNIDMEGKNTGMLIGKRGQTLDALQYLTSLVVNKKSDSYIRLKLDTENYRERRKETLENLARNIASKAKRTGREVSLEPMNPYERRIIHSALQNDPGVTTYSEGENLDRHVIVAPTEPPKREYRRYNRR